jgi:ABC-type enterochelin transport system ATPase subunit
MPEETDALASLEEQITRAVQVVMTLRQQNAELQRRLEAALAERNQALAERDQAVAFRDEALSASQNAQNLIRQAEMIAEKSRLEAEELKSERRQVRTRIEKLLGQMDLLGQG